MNSVKVLSVFGAIWSVAAMGQGFRVSLSQSVESPVPLGSKVVWSAAADSGGAPVWYRFRSRALGSPFETIRDFGPETNLEWTAAETEGLYEVQVSGRNLESGETDTASAVIQMTSRVAGGAPIVSPTGNQLVFLYSAPACLPPGRMRVQFQASDGVATVTPFKDCLPGSSMNFYLAGLRAGTTYSARQFLDTGVEVVSGPLISFTTPEVSFKLAPYSVLLARPETGSEGILLQSTLSEMTVATDLAGNLVWYYPAGITSLTRPVGNGRFLGIFQFPSLDPSHEYVREFDVAGFTIRETNAARVSDNLRRWECIRLRRFITKLAASRGGSWWCLPARSES